MNSSLNVILPPNFIKPSPKNPSPKPNPTPGDNGKQKGRGKKRKSKDATGDCITKNAVPISKFQLKESENWRRNFTRKCLRIASNGTTLPSCVLAGGSAANVLSTAASRQATWEHVLFPKRSAPNSRNILIRFAGRTPPPPWPDSPGRDFAMSGLTQSRLILLTPHV